MDTTNKNQYGTIAKTPEEMALNRSNLQQNLSNIGTSSTINNGVVVPTTITSDILKSNPTPLKLPEQKVSTTATGLISSIQSENQALTKQLEADKKLAEEAKKSSQTDYYDTINKMIGIQGTRGAEETKANLPQFRQDVADISSQIEAKQVSIQRQIEKAQKASGGLVGGANDAIQAIERQGARDLADLSITQSAINRNLSVAQANVDRKIELQLEPLKTMLDYKKTVYEDNKENYTKAEDRKYQESIKKDQREFDKEEERLKTLGKAQLSYMDTAVALGKGNSVITEINSAKTIEEVLNVASRNGVISLDDQYKQQQILKLDAEKKKLLAETTYQNNPIVKDSPLVDAMFNVNAGSAEGQQKRDIQRVASLVSNNQPRQAKELIMSRVTSKMSAGERDAQLDRRNTIDALEDMQSALNEYVSLSGNTNLLKGSIEDVANKIGTTSDPRLVSIKTRIIQATQKYRNSITGAAWGEQEDKEYRTIFPSIKNTAKLNNTIIDTMIPLLKNNEKNAISAFLGGTDIYDDVFGGVNKNQDPLGLGIQTNQKTNNPLGI